MVLWFPISWLQGSIDLNILDSDSNKKKRSDAYSLIIDQKELLILLIK